MTNNPKFQAGAYGYTDKEMNDAALTELTIPLTEVGGEFIGWGARGLASWYKAYKTANAFREITVIGETMKRVESVASKIPGARTFTEIPELTGPEWQQTSQLMQANRQWILNELRSGRTILDIGLDANRTQPSIFYQMEQNMIKNYHILHP